MALHGPSENDDWKLFSARLTEMLPPAGSTSRPVATSDLYVVYP